jgi:hypothetical protein
LALLLFSLSLSLSLSLTFPLHDNWLTGLALSFCHLHDNVDTDIVFTDTSLQFEGMMMIVAVLASLPNLADLGLGGFCL